MIVLFITLFINPLNFHIMNFNLISPQIAYCEAKGLSLCFEAYAENCSNEEIHEIGFNANSGYVYIALENGVQICSCLGSEVEFLTTNFNNGEESFFNSYKCALESL